MASDPDRRRVVPSNGGRQQERERALPQPTEPRYLRTAQVAELLHVSPKTVSRWAPGGPAALRPYLGWSPTLPRCRDPSAGGNPVRAIRRPANHLVFLGTLKRLHPGNCRRRANLRATDRW